MIYDDIMRQIVSKFYHIFPKLLSFALQRPRLTILITFLLLILSLTGVKNLQLELDIYDNVDSDFQSSLDWKEIKDDFGDQNSLILVFQSEKLQQTQWLCQWTQFIKSLPNEFRYVKHSFDALSLRKPKLTNDQLWYPKLLPDPCLSSLTSLDVQKKLFATPWENLFLGKTANRWVSEISINDEEDTNNKDNQKKFSIETAEKVIQQAKLKAAEIDPNGKLEILGPVSFRYFFKKIMAKDSVFNLGILLLIIIAFRGLFGTWKSGLWFAFVLACTLAMLIGIMGWLNYPIDVLSNNLFLMISVSGISDYIFVSFQQFNDSEEKSFFDVITPGFFTTLTTFFGFLTLLSSDLASIQRFGVTAAIGSILEWYMTFILLPALRKTLDLQNGWVNPSQAFLRKKLNSLGELKLSKPLFFTLITLTFLAPVLALRLSFADTPSENFPKNHELHTAIQNFKSQHNWENFVYLVFTPYEKSENIQNVLNTIRQNPLVQNIEDKRTIENEMVYGLDSLFPNLVLRELESSGALSRYISSTNKERSIIYLKEINVDSLKLFRESVQKVCGSQCSLVGQPIVYLDYNERISLTLSESLIVSIIIILIILGVIHWSLQTEVSFWALALSSIVGPLCMISIMSIFQVPVNLITSIFIATLVGISGDNAIQFMFSGKSIGIKEGIQDRMSASIASALLLAACSFFFVFQTLIPIKWLGVLFVVGFIVNLAGDLWVLKALLPKNDISEQKYQG